MVGIGEGLAVFAFWGFVAVCVVAGIWESIRKRDARHETVRRIIESGKDIDMDSIERMLDGEKKISRNLKFSAVIMLFVAPGLALLGLFIAKDSPDELYPLLGVSLLVGCIAIGLFAAAKIAGRDERDDN